MKLVELWSEALGIKKEVISIAANFFDLGGHSLTTTTLLSTIHRDLDVRIPLAEMFKNPTITGLSTYIKSLETEETFTSETPETPETSQKSQILQDKYENIEPIEEKEYYPLSSAQKRLYFLQQLDLNGIGYNMPLVLPLDKDIDKERLEYALNRLISRHESLRTSFQTVNEEAVQRIHKKVTFNLEYYNLATEDTEDTEGEKEKRRVENFIRPFDLTKAPLMRSALLKHPEGNYTWLIDIHHIISDGTSHNILTQDFMRLYKGDSQLEPLPIQYKDFAQWQNRLFAGGKIESQEKYWLDLFTGEIPSLDLPTDYKRPAVFTFAGDSYRLAFSGAEAALFKKLNRQSGGTLYMNMLAALNTLFNKYTGQEDIIIGCGIAGRSHANLQGIVGVFINTLALRNYPHGEMPYDIFLKEVIDNSIKAFENQDVQFENLVEKLDIVKDLSRNPLFDIMMMGDNFYKSNAENTGEKFSEDEYHGITSKFDMTFFLVEANENFYIDIQYYSDIFKRETIQRMGSHLTKIIMAAGQNPAIKLRDIEIITDEEKRQLMVEFNDTGCDYPRDKTIHQLFIEQAAQTPDYIALHGCMDGWRHDSMDAWMDGEVARNVSLTYRQLNDQSDRLAGLLTEKGVLPDNIVAIKIERSVEMIIGIMGILKSGGAYLPIDPEYPQERIDYMLKDSNTKILITNDEQEKKINCQCSIVNCQLSINGCPRRGLQHSAFITQHSNHLCYVIYTSGSTGRPKGVTITYRNVVNFIQGITALIDFSVGKTILALTTICFDIFFLETLLPLVKGLKVVIASVDQQRDPRLLADALIKNKIDMLQITPSRLKLLMDCDNDLICVAGSLYAAAEARSYIVRCNG
ncbi:MAG: condensation domain-containing protein [Acidobacteria bacterium]|nr:condensation domain-containing protein [Acidobacteriota bacterium]